MSGTTLLGLGLMLLKPDASLYLTTLLNDVPDEYSVTTRFDAPPLDVILFSEAKLQLVDLTMAAISDVSLPATPPDLTHWDSTQLTLRFEGTSPSAIVDANVTSILLDNCPDISNADQTDSDGDGTGDVCENDADSDGYTTAVDCDDNNPSINPGAVESCNDEIDNDCDGQVDAADSQCDEDKEFSMSWNCFIDTVSTSLGM